MKVTNKELATVLAALRHWQRYVQDKHPRMVQQSHEHFEDERPLTPEEIDDLCERLNTDTDKGHMVQPDPKNHMVIFEWIGEGNTPEERAQNAWDNMRKSVPEPMVTVLAPDGTTTEVDLDSTPLIDDEDGEENEEDDGP